MKKKYRILLMKKDKFKKEISKVNDNKKRNKKKVKIIDLMILKKQIYFSEIQINFIGKNKEINPHENAKLKHNKLIQRFSNK